MHFSIPDTKEFKDESGTTYTVSLDILELYARANRSRERMKQHETVRKAFNVHINGAFHCTVRYRQLHHFHEQLKKEFGSTHLPSFPPKKLLPLTQNQLEERRAMLERYIQMVSQENSIANCDLFNGFLLNAQQETQHQTSEAVTLDVHLMNGHKITVDITSTVQTEDVLESVASLLEIPEDLIYYFGLFLVRKEVDRENSIVRKLQEFESPYISLKAANKECPHRMVLRKSYWDSSYDDDLLDNRVTKNLLYIQAVNDLEHQWVLSTKEQSVQLANLQQKGSKRDFLRLCRTLKYYGYLHFQPCVTDYPHPDSRVLLAVGNKELSFRVESGSDQHKERIFKITRMRCWRITTIYCEADNNSNRNVKPQLEISFEYLLSKDTLQWITIKSSQAILVSMCLQGMVDELLAKKQGKHIKRPQDTAKRSKVNFPKRDNNSTIISPNQQITRSLSENEDQSAIDKAVDSVKKISDKFANVSFMPTSRSSQKLPGVLENNAFEEIGDEDL